MTRSIVDTSYIISRPRAIKYATLAQLAEHRTCNARVVCSIHTGSSRRDAALDDEV